MKISWLIVLLIGVKIASSQELEPYIQEIIGHLNNETDDLNLDLEAYTEILLNYANSPMFLQTATQEELESLGFVNPAQIQSILAYTEKHKILSIYEIQAIPKIDLATTHRLLPFIRIKGNEESAHVPFGKLLSTGKHQIYQRYSQDFPKNADFIPDENGIKKFEGNASKLYMRYKYQYGQHLSYGITAEKDAGEAFFTKSNKRGFDFYSYHFYWKPNNKIHAIALGDYQANLGQGLVIWSGFGSRKSAQILRIKKTGRTIAPFTSVSETNALRGAAVVLKWNRISSTSFVSFKRMDAAIDTSQSLITASLQSSGLHRTASEIRNEASLKHLLVGQQLKVGSVNKSIAWNVLYSSFNLPIRSLENLYAIHRFHHQHLLNTSLDYSFLFHNFLFFGEVASSVQRNNMGLATINGLLFSPDKKIDVALVHRYYGPKYQSTTRTNSFGENSSPNNESGIYAGIEYRLTDKWRITANADNYVFPWLKFQVDKPSSGHEYRFAIHGSFTKTSGLSISYRSETKEANVRLQLNDKNQLLLNKYNEALVKERFGDELEIQQNHLGERFITSNPNLSLGRLQNAQWILFHRQHKVRIHLHYSFLKNWQFKTRMEWAFFSDGFHTPSRGLLLYQDFRFSSKSLPISFVMRISIFDIQGYDARIYSYENNVLGQYSVPSFSNRGFRYYCNIHIKMRFLDLWIRYASSQFSANTRNSVEEPKPNSRSINAQIRWSF